MKLLKKVGLILGGLLVLIIGIAVVFGLSIHEKRPEGKICTDADNLAMMMMESVNCAAWDSIEVVSWTFGGRNEHLWDRTRHLNRVRSGDTEVLIDLNSRWGIVKKNGEKIEGKAAKKALEKAWANWANDSFWLNPICKAFDNGTDRYLIQREGQGDAVMVSYRSGGVTPGDSYLWIMDENARPTHWQMWVKIIPVGGMKASWDDYQTLYNGAKVASSHQFSLGNIKLELTDISAGTAEEIYKKGDPFAELLSEQ